MDQLHWFLMLPGITDRDLFGFEADGWSLTYRDPAMGMLGIVPAAGGTPATLDDARWLADVVAFDHDAPIGVSPAWKGVWPNQSPMDATASKVTQPIQPFEGSATAYYWEHIGMSYVAVAELRFNGSYQLRYSGEEGDPQTNFTERFRNREELIALYGMAARQVDPLAEYLLLYRILEAGDNGNGKSFLAKRLPDLRDGDFGRLWVAPDSAVGAESAVNAFEIYRQRALRELDRLETVGVTDLAGHLYGLRNAVAHGRRDSLFGRDTDRTDEAQRALPIVKLMARMIVEPPSWAPGPSSA